MFTAPQNVPSTAADEDSEEEQEEQENNITLLQKRREECERKARRGEMDPRLEFTFQLLIDATGLPRSEIMDNVFEGNMLDEINELFLPHMRNKLIWFYQDVEEKPAASSQELTKVIGGLRAIQGGKTHVHATSTIKKKLFLTDGWETPLTGICIYMFRLSTTKQLPEEGFQKDLFCGVINAVHVGLVTTVQRVMEFVFMEALAQPSTESEEEEVGGAIVRDQLLPGLRSFCSALKVCEDVCKEPNIFDDGKNYMESIVTFDDAKAFLSPENIAMLEERLKLWLRRIHEVIMESEQLRKENDTSGPQDELEYWKKRDAQFSQIVSQIQAHEVTMTVQCLLMVKSKMLKLWREADARITYCYNEARDNAKYVQAIEKSCHALYLYDPVRMKGSILRLLQTVRLIHSVSQFYNTSERTSSLMVKITNQMIKNCKQYITCHGKETIWSQDRAVTREKLVHCVKLNKAYHDSYIYVKEHNYVPDQPPLQFSENYVFGKFDTFCRRLTKIISMFNLVDDYNSLFECRMEGLLLGEELEDVIKQFNEIKNGITSKTYDYLDHRNQDFDNDFEQLIANTNMLKERIANTIEENYAGIWETLQGVKFLNRFEKISGKIPLKQMSEKYTRILKFCDSQLDRVLRVFRKQNSRPPVPRDFPPLSGKICWARSLRSNLKRLVESVSEHPLLKPLPETSEIQRKFAYINRVLEEYEKEVVEKWLNLNVWVAENCLRKKLLVFNEKEGTLEINFDYRLRLLIREAECMAKMDLPVPVLNMTLLNKKDHFIKIEDSLNDMLDRFLKTVRRVKLEVRPLFLPQLVRLTALLNPALRDLTWTDPEWRNFIGKTNEAVDSFDILITRVHDVYANRILFVLSSIQNVNLHVLPQNKPWTIEEFIERTDENCRHAAVELNRKSLMVEEAVEEILELVRKSAEEFKAIAPNNEVEFLSEVVETEERTETSDGAQQQQDWSIVSECFENPFQLIQSGGGLSKPMQDMVRNAVGEMRRYYSRKVVDVLIKITRQALEAVRRRFTMHDGNTPVLIIHALLLIPNVIVKPSLDEVQECLLTIGKTITNVARGVSQWSGGKPQAVRWKRLGLHGNRAGPKALANLVTRLDQGETKSEDAKERRKRLYRLASNAKPPFPHQPRNFHFHIMENKEVVKTLSLLSTCIIPIKMELLKYVNQWKPYKMLWSADSISTKRDVYSVSLLDCEMALSKHVELDNNILAETDVYIVSLTIAVNIEQLKLALALEIKQSTHKIGQIIRKKYQREMDYVYAVMSEMERKLDRPIRDLDDVRMVMDTLKKIRDQEVDIELKIEPIEEAFNILTRYELPVDREVLEQVDNLRYTWQQLLGRSMEVNTLLLAMQPHFQEELQANLTKFREDSEEYIEQYRTCGPMSPGLSPREASDRLILFQVNHLALWFNFFVASPVRTYV
ncbi:dynein heavy chain [Nesidiocoris tenuis]|uniref:Dynein heavy chain n=2 Tax=Nesidiocoris tenuis TaxID=355587 RepID=A0ABN7B156_9HEMI|nr:dynein heavy chain [Nesidiocoris tenuis]